MSTQYNITIVSGQGTANLNVSANFSQYAQGALIEVTITDNKGLNRVVNLTKNIVLGALFTPLITYAAHGSCGTYIFFYNGQAFSPPNRYFEIMSLNAVQLQPYPSGYPGTGLPTSTLYDRYGGAVTVTSGTGQVKVRFKNECGWSDWTSTISLPT